MIEERFVSPASNSLKTAVWAALAAATILLAAVLVERTAPVVIAILAVCVLWCAVIFMRALPTTFLGALGLLLAGYALFGRSVAYLGAPPVFVGEMTLALGIAAAFASGSVMRLVRSPTVWLILALSVWGAAQTIPYVKQYGSDALRDAALWGYGAFAIATAACLHSTRSIPLALRQYGRWLIPFVAWLPAVLILGRFLGSSIPNMPGTEVPLFSAKAGDASVHLAGAAAFILLGLHRDSSTQLSERPQRARLFWTLWMTSFLFAAAMNRGGFLAVSAAMFVLCALDPLGVGKRLAVWGLMAIVAASALMLLTNPASRAELAATDERALSPRQIVENVLSITGRESQARGSLSSTREWRLDWWTTIIDYTVHGRYFWTGKGFGVNLADDDGFQVVGGETPLRSPHNAYMTVLARAGVPGILLWIALQACFATSLVVAYFRARVAGEWWWARVDLWILSYWVAFLVNAAFDVFLEGPQGGIWFWCVVGLGIGVVEAQRRGVSAPRWVEMAS